MIEVIDPEGHLEIVTVGIDMAPLRLRKGDRVDVSLLDGLVVDLERSKATALSFDREDIIMPMDNFSQQPGQVLSYTLPEFYVDPVLVGLYFEDP